MVFNEKGYNGIKNYLWLILVPFIVAAILTSLILMLWKPASTGIPFGVVFISFFVLIWMFAAYIFDLAKVKAAITILNAIILSVLAVTFITSFDMTYSMLVFDMDMIKEAQEAGVSSNGLLEYLIKLLILPYLLAGIWGAVIAELRQTGVIKERYFKFLRKRIDKREIAKIGE